GGADLQAPGPVGADEQEVLSDKAVADKAAAGRRAEMGFDDMLTRLDQALAGENGPRLAEVIRRQFPVALIDEFQDTDPLQYRIFDAIYRVADNGADRGLFMIGDPKQAIYAFRGADIHTYLAARAATEGRHYSLDTNFRSSEAMVDAVNRLFERAEQHPEGAFLFRQGGQNPLPFVPVAARGRHRRPRGFPAPAGTGGAPRGAVCPPGAAGGPGPHVPGGAADGGPAGHAGPGGWHGS
ncbi:UvrD-helicase domain-containing protein, partial [Zobellella denitrificans]|uniref:UvrD-helicase domain-containing protein n=1 Tax=Zobellella denitrificans TaxID=347534 RepID=UPI0020CEACEF